jgi:SH3-like domain-containing protein
MLGRGIAAALLLSLAACSRHAEAPAADAGRKTPSGQPVPRYVSLKFDKVNARAGPADDSRLLWIYHARGLPLQVVAETDEWRRVCDPSGAVAWVHRRTVGDRHTVMNTGNTGLGLRARPTEAAGETAVLVGRAVADLKGCQGGWCQVSVGHAKGWAPEAVLWGTSDALQCR